MVYVSMGVFLTVCVSVFQAESSFSSQLKPINFTALLVITHMRVLVLAHKLRYKCAHTHTVDAL